MSEPAQISTLGHSQSCHFFMFAVSVGRLSPRLLCVYPAGERTSNAPNARRNSLLSPRRNDSVEFGILSATLRMTLTVWRFFLPMKLNRSVIE